MFAECAARIETEDADGARFRQCGKSPALQTHQSAARRLDRGVAQVKSIDFVSLAAKNEFFIFNQVPLHTLNESLAWYKEQIGLVSLNLIISRYMNLHYRIRVRSRTTC